MRPSPSSRALEAIFRDFAETTDGATYFAERVWVTRLRYDLGATDPLVGSSAQDFELEDALDVEIISETARASCWTSKRALRSLDTNSMAVLPICGPTQEIASDFQQCW